MNLLNIITGMNAAFTAKSLVTQSPSFEAKICKDDYQQYNYDFVGPCFDLLEEHKNEPSVFEDAAKYNPLQVAMYFAMSLDVLKDHRDAYIIDSVPQGLKYDFVEYMHNNQLRLSNYLTS